MSTVCFSRMLKSNRISFIFFLTFAFAILNANYFAPHSQNKKYVNNHEGRAFGHFSNFVKEGQAIVIAVANSDEEVEEEIGVEEDDEAEYCFLSHFSVTISLRNNLSYLTHYKSGPPSNGLLRVLSLRAPPFC